MKRLFISILFLFSVSCIFADEFSLFPWICNQKDVYSFCINKGWEYSSDVSDSITTFYFTPKSTTYHGNKVYRFRFSFDKDELIIQAMTFDDMLELDMALASLLESLVQDKARLVDKKLSKADLYTIQYNAELSNNITAKYFIIGQGNVFQNSIAYIKE